MKYSTSACLVLCLIAAFACSDKDQDQRKKTTVHLQVGYRNITDEEPGAAYRTRARHYFTIRGSDTSGFTCIFSESKADSSVRISAQFQPDLTYEQQLEELETLLPEAAKDFDMSRLKGIGIGRLVSTGDLAAHIAQQYYERFGGNTSIGSYSKVALFLKQSPLGADMNRLLHPFGHNVDHISVEKVFFTSRRDLYQHSILSTDTSLIPEQVLDCLTWVGVTPE